MYCHSFRLFFSACSHWKTLFTSTSDSPPFFPSFCLYYTGWGQGGQSSNSISIVRSKQHVGLFQQFPQGITIPHHLLFRCADLYHSHAIRQDFLIGILALRHQGVKFRLPITHPSSPLRSAVGSRGSHRGHRRCQPHPPAERQYPAVNPCCCAGTEAFQLVPPKGPPAEVAPPPGFRPWKPRCRPNTSV